MKASDFLFVTLEGPEGSGKSTQIIRLLRWLRKKGNRVIAVHDPGSTGLGRAVRKVLLHTQTPLSPQAEALLFIGSRVQLVEEKIRPAMAQGKVVVCDRFHDSTIAYQGFGGGIDVEWLERVGRHAIAGFMPTLTILLDVPVEHGFGRFKRGRDRMERKAKKFHRKVRLGFLEMARRQPKRFVVVDARQKPDMVWAAIRQIVEQRLRLAAGRN